MRGGRHVYLDAGIFFLFNVCRVCLTSALGWTPCRNLNWLRFLEKYYLVPGWRLDSFVNRKLIRADDFYWLFRG